MVTVRTVARRAKQKAAALLHTSGALSLVGRLKEALRQDHPATQQPQEDLRLERIEREVENLNSLLRVRTTGERAATLLEYLTPSDAVGANYIRLGRPNDGGYVMVSNLLTGGIAYSLGISDDVSWDAAMAERGYEIFQYDHTIEALPAANTRFHFEKHGISAYGEDSAQLSSLDTLVARNGHIGEQNMVLKIDIEGAEWDVFSTILDSTLLKFSQIVVEFHWFDNADNNIYFGKAFAALQRLTSHFFPVHVHANNFGQLKRMGEIIVPTILEVTFLRKGTLDQAPCTRSFPTPIDQPNNPDRADFQLGKFKASEMPRSTGISRDEIRRAYQIVLGREPEGESAYNAQAHLRDYDALLRVLLNSDEYRQKSIGEHLPQSHEAPRKTAIGENAPTANVRTLTTIQELDEAVTAADRCPSDDALRNHLGSFRVSLPNPKGDPFGSDYAQAIIAQYEQISGRKYGFENEHTSFDFNAALTQPFPYSTRSTSTVSDYFIQIFYLLRVLALPPGKTVADLGPGWGNTTEILSRMGYDTHAVDINIDFCNLIKERLSAQSLTANVVCGDFFAVEKLPELDAAIFFESFHHCLEHARLLSVLYEKTRQDGVILFAGEPISQNSPFPWGVRHDGMAMWSVRKFGWLELGFSEDYFLSVLLRAGWAPSRFSIPGYMPGYKATKTRFFEPGLIQWPESCEWGAPETDRSLRHRFTSGKTNIPLRAGTALITMRNLRPTPLAVSISGQRMRLAPGATENVHVNHSNGIVIKSEVWCPNDIFNNGDIRQIGVLVDGIELIA